MTLLKLPLARLEEPIGLCDEIESRDLWDLDELDPIARRWGRGDNDRCHRRRRYWRFRGRDRFLARATCCYEGESTDRPRRAEARSQHGGVIYHPVDRPVKADVEHASAVAGRGADQGRQTRDVLPTRPRAGNGGARERHNPPSTWSA